MSPSDSERCQRHTVPPAEADARLDRFLARRHQGLGRRDAAALIAEGAVRIQRGEGQAPVGARKGDRLRAGDVVVVTASEARLARHRAETPPWPAAVEGVHIRHVDDELVVLAKPAGVPTHPLRPGEAGTAANHLALRHPECVQAGGPPREGGLCHRLDTLTSGLLIAARTPRSYQWLRARFREHQVHKTYLALATGAPERAFTVEAPVASRRGRRRVDVGHGQPAETSIRVLKQYRDAALVAAETRHGRRHQIRAHLAHAGHPLVADELYGGRPLVQEAGLSLPSPLPLPLPLLHAAALELPHPAPPHARVTHGEDLPGALQQALARLARR